MELQLEISHHSQQGQVLEVEQLLLKEVLVQQELEQLLLILKAQGALQPYNLQEDL